MLDRYHLRPRKLEHLRNLLVEHIARLRNELLAVTQILRPPETVLTDAEFLQLLRKHLVILRRRGRANALLPDTGTHEAALIHRLELGILAAGSALDALLKPADPAVI